MTPRVIETLRKNAKTVMQKTAKPAIVIAIVILLLVDAVIGSYFYSNLGDIINFSSFNPPVQEKLAYMTLSYPPIPPTSTLYVAGYSNSTVQFDTFTMTVLLRYNGTLAEGTPVIVLATCTFIRKNIALISIGFQGAEPYNATSAQLPYYMLLETVHESPRISDKNGNPSPNNDYWIEWQQNQNIPQLATIDWTWPGNYYPILQVLYKNLTQVTQPYPDWVIPVNSANSIQQEHEQIIYDRLTLWLTVAIFLFAFIESFDAIAKLHKLGWGGNHGKNDRNSTNNPT